MRRLAVVFAVVAAMVAGALPASADPPTKDVQDPVVFEDVDPCTGEIHTVTIQVTFFDHFHAKNVVFRDGDRSGFTSSGYVLQGGHFLLQGNENAFHFHFVDVWRNPDTGDKMQATGRVRFAGNSMAIDEFTLRCIGAPTLS